MPGSFTSDCSHDPEDIRDLQVLLDRLARPGSDRGSSVNMTACVIVPSSEHVAEIVGRQGCRIKALRAKTNTYIKTPLRGEEPVFLVTGRGEDVAAARREILSAAEHFTAIRSCRNQSAGGTRAPGRPGLTTVLVRVPHSFVGLVVGPKGATIKRIQQLTHTSITTPSRDQEPVFEVRGMPENVDQAREEIQAHIALRTGAPPEPQDRNDFEANGTETGLWSRPGSGLSPEWEQNRNRSSISVGSSSTDSPAASPMPMGGWW
ncbi:RNA-binding protein MEX3B [Oryzias melastigma]|uniref:RNA-binding protein MEX3B n=1 Tax=Oryzias melastigma TaxID=30732 RepID=UPI000CF7ECFE|nr:RNA-binding protein MEX3B [Oryzias melastigma]